MMHITKQKSSHLLSVAPMMDCTDKHDRYFLRLIAPDVRLYTEMITGKALKHGDVKRLLDFHPSEHPLTLQLGGSDPKELAHAAIIGEAYGYDEINLNVGCPSDRVQSGQFGACLMLKPDLVAECVAAMKNKISIPVTVKCRIGVDEHDSYEFLYHFIQTVSAAQCDTFIIHARKAWLTGLSPKENRTVPPLCYEAVAELKKDFPHLKFILNGGITTLQEVIKHLTYADGVMIGRRAYANPYILAELQQYFYPKRKVLSRHQVIEQMIPYTQVQLSRGVKLTSITRHLFGLFQSQRGAAAWRRHLSENAYKAGMDASLLKQALSLIG